MVKCSLNNKTYHWYGTFILDKIKDTYGIYVYTHI